MKLEKKTVKMSNFIKVLPVGTELFHADRRTDMTKLTLAFGTFATAIKNSNVIAIFSLFAIVVAIRILSISEIRCTRRRYSATFHFR
jgi:hypothetical protein